MNSYVMADPRKCIGCHSCEIACALSHMSFDLVTAGDSRLPFTPRLVVVRGQKVAMPIQCRQCEDAPCVKACLQKAISQGDHRVEIDQSRCNGCKSCVVACPFGAMGMGLVPSRSGGGALASMRGLAVVQEDGRPREEPVYSAFKCDLCTGRASGPACVEICPAKAFTFVTAEVVHERFVNRRAEGLRAWADLAPPNPAAPSGG